MIIILVFYNIILLAINVWLPCRQKKRNYGPLENFMTAVRFAQSPGKFKTEIYLRQHHMDIIKEIFNRKKSHFMMISWHGNAFRFTGPLWCEWTDHPHKGSMIWSRDVFSLLAWTNYLTNSQVTIDQISVSLRERTAMVTCESPSQTVQSFDVFFVVCLNKLLNKQSSYPKFEIKADRPLHRSIVDSCPKGQQCGGLTFLLAWISCWTNS